jgi:hypothetical protein
MRSSFVGHQARKGLVRRVSERLLGIYKWFLELPVVIVLVVLGLMGAALMGSLALGLYLLWTFLVGALAGS